MDQVIRAINILVEEGPVEFLKRIRNYGVNKARDIITPVFWYWKFRGSKPINISEDTIHISISDYYGDYREVKFIEENEVDQIQDVLEELGEEDVFMDVGANIGIYSLFAENYVDTVIGFEPHPTNCSHFQHNCQINNSNVTVISCALSDFSGFIGLSGPRGGLKADGSVTISNLTNKESQVQVRSEIGDKFLQENDFPIPNIIKIDVEGAEDQVLEGLEETLKNPECRIVYCEVHENLHEKLGFKITDQSDSNQIIEKLRVAEFEINIIDSRDYGSTIKGKK